MVLFEYEVLAIKPLFAYGQAAGIRLAFLLASSIGLMAVDHKYDYLDGIRSSLAILIYPVQQMVAFPVSAGNWMGENLTSRDSLLKKIDSLESQNVFLKAQMQKYTSLEIENMRLRDLLDAAERTGEKVLAAELIAVDLDPFSHKVLINKGNRHNAFKGQPVLDAEGVFGQTVHVTPITSVIMLISDPSHALPVQIDRTGLRTIAAGTGAMDKLELLHIPNNADLKVGDTVSSSGLGGVFPQGYPVAEIISFESDPTQPYARVFATPKARLDRSREVLLVWREKTKIEEVPPAPQVSKKGNPKQEVSALAP
ncbi:MAG: rod shape-determining protein MreC [Gammaproteobacteria bacterium]|nr:rod shape-determining protein MreC [Gammaproteobacteria bacterium]